MTPFNFNMFKKFLNRLPGDFFSSLFSRFFYVLLSVNIILVFHTLV